SRIQNTGHIVVGQSRSVRQRNQFLDPQCDGIQFLRWNNVVRVGVAVADSTYGSLRGWVVDGVLQDWASKPIGPQTTACERLPEIAPAIGERRHCNWKVI